MQLQLPSRNASVLANDSSSGSLQHDSRGWSPRPLHVSLLQGAASLPKNDDNVKTKLWCKRHGAPTHVKSEGAPARGLRDYFKDVAGSLGFDRTVEFKCTSNISCFLFLSSSVI
ncbi:uncharacterized protein LOC126109694 [Schistocerca cancellata]|uniref:uncharacterized protein LOC126109694 n=1 Tax=Schistocerca cancellata TaxID=274614 RepID=UPI002117C1FC|nr:uncharacterized protein LOC126109694 [Schistocerca cancellata]